MKEIDRCENQIFLAIKPNNSKNNAKGGEQDAIHNISEVHP